MIYKKAIALLLTAVMIFSFTACNEVGDSSSSPVTNEEIISEKRDFLTLLYSATDTFNPYTAKTDINRQLCNLLYEPLVRLDNEFNPVYSLAESVSIDGKTCTAVIKNALFSDGTSVKADDIVYSFNLAKNSASAYSSELYICSSASASNSNTVVFSLTKNDPYFINLLDFPILKAGSENITDSDSVLQPPIGCGRYKVNDTRDGLVINDGYYGEKSSITEIKLINSPDIESVSHYVEVGAADMYYSDISDGSILRMSGKKIDINLNNLVYIGFNRKYGALSHVELRQAISSAIDRKKISTVAFYNNALPATGFFNPVWEETKSLQNIQIQTKSQITIENLEKIGYNTLDTNGIRVNSAGTPLKFTLLVNSENRIRAAAAQLIADQLSQYGISISVIEKDYENYLASLSSGNFQLYLGEIKITDNMDISSIVSKDSAVAFGLPDTPEEVTTENTAQTTDSEDSETESADSETVINGYYEGINTISDVAAVLQTEMPVVPVCYRTGVLFCNDNIENAEGASASDIYFSIQSYIYSK